MFHLRFHYVYNYNICNLHCIDMYVRNAKQRRQKTGRLHKRWLQLSKLAAPEDARNMSIPERLASRRLFRVDIEAEARKCASADDSYHEQEVSVRCAKEQLVTKGPCAYYADRLAPDCLWKNNHNAENTIPEHVARLQSLHTPSP